MAVLSELKTIWVRGTTVYYPLKTFANVSYDATSVTVTNTAALNFTATLSVLYWFTFNGLDGEDAINTVNLRDVRDGSVAWSFNFDQEPNTDPTSPSGSKPRTMRFGRLGMQFPHGIGLSGGAATATMLLAYRDIIP